MYSRCWQEWDGQDSDLTTPRQIMILAQNLRLQKRVFHRENVKRNEKVTLVTIFKIHKLSLLYKMDFQIKLWKSFWFSHPLFLLLVSPPLPLALDTALVMTLRLISSLASDWSTGLTSHPSWLPKIPTSTKTLTLFSVSRQGCLWILDKDKGNPECFLGSWKSICYITFQELKDRCFVHAGDH